MSLTVRQDGASVALTGDLAAWAERALKAGSGGAVDAIRAALQPVADSAASQWYGPQGVHRQSGQSGRMAVTTTIDASTGTVRVSVGSTDPRTDKRGQLARLIHRRGPLAKKPGDGKQLLPIFVTGPAKLAIKAALPAIGDALARSAGTVRTNAG